MCYTSIGIIVLLFLVLIFTMGNMKHTEHVYGIPIGSVNQYPYQQTPRRNVYNNNFIDATKIPGQYWVH
jgi:hypothetical protein